MLSTVIYRSRVAPWLSEHWITPMLIAARKKNIAMHITGILIFDGTHFFQVLEGPEQSLTALLSHIRDDPRHREITTLLRDYAPFRRFSSSGMDFFDVRGRTHGKTIDELYSTVADHRILHYDDRILTVVRACINGDWRDGFVEMLNPTEWEFCPEDGSLLVAPLSTPSGQTCQFALQAIVEPLNRRITSVEALIRGPHGEPPAVYFGGLSPRELYQADLESKSTALSLAKNLKLHQYKISINLLPMTLTSIEGAVETLLGYVLANGLEPEQIVVEVTEEEVVAQFDTFRSAIKKLRAAGIGLAIDDFGAGFAGLSLLTEWQPEKLKIDRKIIEGVNAHGPRQAIVASILRLCRSLGISVVAEGVETVEEWCWLQAAGIERFQGYLFGRPTLNQLGPISWPRKLVQS